GVRLMERETVEADDMIGSAACQFAARGDEALILTSDKDIMQARRPGVKILRPSKGVSSFEVYDEAVFTEKYGFPPSGMVDYLALMGDAVDNIKGVPGVGKKTAATLMHDYGTIENIIAHADELKPALRKKIAEHSQTALDNRVLTRLKCDEDLSEFTSTEPIVDLEAFARKCARLGMKKVAETFGARLPAHTDESVQPLSLDEDETPKVSSTTETLPIIEPAGAISLNAVLLAPRLALDFDETKFVRTFAPDPAASAALSVILAAPDGSWWQGSFSELAPKLAELDGHTLVTLDAKSVCYLAELPVSCAVFDIKSAYYLLHPDLETYDAAKELGLAFSPERALRLLSLGKVMERQIEEQKMTSVLTEIDTPLIPVLVSMERRGIRLDREKMTALSGELNTRIAELTESICATVGMEVNLNSPKQVGEMLFEKLGLPVIKKTKTGYSTDVSVLEQLRDICGNRCLVPAQLLEYRELAKMSSGFVQPLMAAAGADGLIHSTFEALVTGTGRLSSRDPNMQNLPAYSGWGARIRECLVPAAPGNCFVAADYSQIELRVLAHLSGDPQLIEIFNSDRDIHTETASLIFGLPPEAVTKELRRSAKTVSFGLIYGMNVFGLASRLGTDRNSANRIIEAYYAALPGVRDYITTSQAKSLADGYTSTLFGRRRPMDEVSTGNGKRDHQKRVAVNSPIQGTAADITKIAMNKAYARFAGRDVHMVLQVHDSIVCECPRDDAERCARELAEVMENAVSLSVPLKTEQTHGETLASV
ncbi:MAG: DNA polymerase I, partial [Pyramidobacter sp.]|nr:DNA polymerase I [Pyramidobacter sp.]